MVVDFDFDKNFNIEVCPRKTFTVFHLISDVFQGYFRLFFLSMVEDAAVQLLEDYTSSTVFDLLPKYIAEQYSKLACTLWQVVYERLTLAT